MSTPTELDRCRGALVGLAVGDAVGTTVEFKPPGSFAPVTDMVGGGPFHLKPGQWTDDTSMAMCLAESLLACDGFDADDQMRRYVRWWRSGLWSSTEVCFDIGGTVRAALSRYEKTHDPWAGSTDTNAAGNGSLMRLAPVPVWFRRDPEDAIVMAGQSSRTTHATPACVDACRYFAGLLLGAMQGVSKTELLRPRFHPTRGAWPADTLVPAVDAVAAGSFKGKEPPAIKGTGYVVKSLEAALWAFDRTDDFRGGCLAAVNLGDDADTTAAIYGQLAGAYYGVDGIPTAWRERLTRGQEITNIAERLATGTG